MSASNKETSKSLKPKKTPKILLKLEMKVASLSKKTPTNLLRVKKKVTSPSKKSPALLSTKSVKKKLLKVLKSSRIQHLKQNLVEISEKTITLLPNRQESYTVEKSNSSIRKMIENRLKSADNAPTKAVPVLPDAMNNFDCMIYSENDEVYIRKIPVYKEVKGYIKGEVLGRGKFGTVREFVDFRTLKRFAGKILHLRQIEKNHLVRQVSREVSIMFHLDHKNILKIYDLFTTDRKLFLFMELCWGELSELIKHYKVLPECQSKDYFCQILDGVDYIHQRGIFHRDIKPENILIDNAYVLKLADFGCVQEIDFFALTDKVYGNDGTPLFHPPELFNDKLYEYSGSKIDIWASGAILYQMVTGCEAFVECPGESSHVIIKRIQTAAFDCTKPAIQKSALLLSLFKRIFTVDIAERATISEIQNNPWIKNRCKSSLAHYKPFPTTNQKVDSYRSLTVLTRIHEKYYPQNLEKRYVDFKTSELSKKVRPLIRPNRFKESKLVENEENFDFIG